ncbi:hybrid two-components system response regulator and sensor kinase [Janthinobacterium sp. Marseille]|nr:hybrid two-components system response regulator and sensor kinase [Janthinobacterium sp. Marseille]
MVRVLGNLPRLVLMIMKGEKRNNSNVSLAPTVPTILLKFLAMALLLCILAGTALYLYWRLNNVVSTHRRQMNAAAYSAQLYFDQREALLHSIQNSAVLRKDAPRPKQDVADSKDVTTIPFPAQEDGSKWVLLLTERDTSAITNANTRLIYATRQPAAKMLSIWPEDQQKSGLDDLQSQLILQALNDVGSSGEQFLSQKMMWLYVPGKMHDSLYIFSLLDPSRPASGWLGLELRNIVGGIDLSSIHGSSYVLLDQNENVVLHGVPEPGLPLRIKQGVKEDSFGLYGKGSWPEYLALNKSVGEAGWRLVYYIPIRHLLYDDRIAIQLALALCALLVAGVFLGLRHIQKKLILPALRQYDALLDMVTFSQTVIETAPVALCVLRRENGSVALANELTRNWFEHEKDWQAAVLANPYGDKDRDIQLHDGRHVHLTLAPTRYRGEEVLLCVFMDITAHKQIHESLLKAKLHADDANTAKTLFLTTMSHELRTPLHGLLGALELFSLTAVTDQQRMYLHAMQQSSSILLKTVSQTLDIARIEAGAFELETTAFSSLALLEEVIAAYAAPAERKALCICGVPDPAIPELLVGDVTRIKQILNNLMSNAIKFTDSGQVVLRSRLLNLEHGMATIVLQVEDSGRGIDQVHLGRIFEPFYQVEQNAQLKSGTGLGLSICRRFAQMMGGTIWAMSEPGSGTSFSLTVSLQVKQDAAPSEVLALDGVRVHVYSDLRELTTNICGWLGKWGADAHPYQAGNAKDDGEAILLEILHSRLAADIAWQGPRIAAELTALHAGHGRNESERTIRGYCVRAIAEAVRRLQPYQDLVESIHIKPLAFSLNLRVLAVEDNPINQMILKEQLAYLGCDVAFSGNGREALDRPDVMEFDAILTDINMPLVDGYELAERLRGLGYLKPIFGISANVIPEDEQRCLAAGMNLLMTKPLSLSVLQTNLQSIYS